jgi:hypothetical protein
MIRCLVRRCRVPAQVLLASLLACTLLLPACASWDGHLDLLGYTTRPNYDCSIRTVRVPIFKNRTYMTVTPVVGMEMDLTRAVIRQIEMITPYKVADQGADTELRCTIIGFTKTPLNYNQFNTPREYETTLIVDLIWRDLRTGKILSRAPRRPGQPRDADLRQPVLATPDSILPPGSKPVPIGGVPTLPRSDIAAAGQGDDEEIIIDPATRKPPIPVSVRSVAHFRIELGETLTTAEQKNYDRLAQQIVSAMEKAW